MRFVCNFPCSREEAEDMLLEPRQYISVDVETVSLDYPLPLGVAVGIDSERGYYFFNPKDELLYRKINVTPLIILHNASFDLPILDALGLKIRGYEDTMLLAYSAGILDKSLEALSGSVLHKPYTSVTSQWTKKDQGNIGIDHVKMGGWCIQHACNTYALWEKIPHTELYKNIDRPCIDLVLEMEKWGVLIDQYQLTEVEQVAVTRANRLESELKQELGDVNLASNSQMVTALQAKGILGTRKTKGGAESVSEESLKPLNNPVANKLLEWRSVMKTLNTYLPFLRKVDSRGRIHTQYGYTNTGRFNSSKPNLQNITKDSKFEVIDD